jgi:hypothetical protein
MELIICLAILVFRSSIISLNSESEICISPLLIALQMGNGYENTSIAFD